MSRTVRWAAGFVVAITIAAAAPNAPSATAAPHFVARAFTVTAEAFPVEPAPGTQDTEVAVKPFATSSSATNPPSSAFARAAASDLGLAEAYFGQQGPSVAADTSTSGDPDDVVYDEGGTHLEAHVDDSPTALAIASGQDPGSATEPSGSFASRSQSLGSGTELSAFAEAQVDDAAIGPFVLGSGRFDAEVHIDGTPGGASGRGTITTSDATLGGVPIVIDNEGFSIDETKVPAPLLGQATSTIQALFSPGGYADIRVVQPEVELAEDGTSARVSGGGVFVFFTNNDPNERYFAGFTMLGGEAAAALGGQLSTATKTVTVVTAPAAPVAAPVPVALPTQAPDTTPSSTPVTTATDAEAPAPEPAPVETAAEVTYDGGRQVLALRGLWPGFWWIVAAVAAVWLTVGAFHTPWLAPTRRRIGTRVDDVADRFVRG